MKKNRAKIGSWITIYSLEVVEVMAEMGFDWLCVDLEHTSIDYSQAKNLILAIQSKNIKAYVRVSNNDPIIIKRVLDSGADGIIVPMINTKKDAQFAINSIYYHPIGNRGVGLYRAQGYGSNFDNYFNNKSKKVEFYAQIEHIKAIKNLDDILSLKYLSGTIIGPYDMSSSIGKAGDLGCKELKEIIYKYEKKSKKYDKSIGFHVVPIDYKIVKEKINKGYNFIAFGFDLNFLKSSIKIHLSKLGKD